jgi:hypothetical protein
LTTHAESANCFADLSVRFVGFNAILGIVMKSLFAVNPLPVSTFTVIVILLLPDSKQ